MAYPHQSDVVVVTLTEFGRNVVQNGVLPVFRGRCCRLCRGDANGIRVSLTAELHRVAAASARDLPVPNGRRSDRRLLLVLVLASVVALAAACLLGSAPLAPWRVLQALLGLGEAGDRVVVWQIRLPRALAAFATGGALGLSGAALQGLLRNPLAEPGVLGVTASAALCATFAIYYGLLEVTPIMLPLCAIAGALSATALLMVASLRSSSVVTLILTGVGLSSFATAIMALLMNLAPNPFSLADMVGWMLGSVANRSFLDLRLCAPFILGGCALLLASGRGLSALTLGEEAAAGVGLNVTRVRLCVVIGAGLATGGAVALAGAVGFVGIVAPHMVRPFVGHDPARCLWPSAWLAGTGLVLADIGVRLLPTKSELHLGVVAALIGAPVFVWIVTRRGALRD